MSTQTEPDSNHTIDVRPTSYTLECLTQAVADPLGPAMDELLASLRTSGIRHAGSTKVRARASVYLRQRPNPFPTGVAFLLQRLELSNSSPSYEMYTARALLSAEMDGLDGPVLARTALRLIADLLESLLELPVLAEHPKRAALERHVQQILDTCRERGFSAEAELAYTTDPLLIAVTLLPESSEVEEVIFLRVVQSQEVIFNVADALVERAIRHVVFGDLAQAIVELQWVASLEELFAPLFRLLLAMDVPRWLALRPYIVLPSALQSIAYHNLRGRLNELARIIGHPRVPKWEQPNLARSRALVRAARRGLSRWIDMHAGEAEKYTPGGSEGVQWLRKQQAREKAKKH